MGLLCVVCHDGGGCICNLGFIMRVAAFSLQHFRNLKEGSRCRCRNKIETIGEKKEIVPKVNIERKRKRINYGPRDDAYAGPTLVK